MKQTIAFVLTAFTALAAQPETPSVFTVDEAQSTARVTDVVHPKQSPEKTLLGPAQMRHFYHLENVASQGEGQVIAIIGAHHNPRIEHDLIVFSNRFGLPTCTFSNHCLQQLAVVSSTPQNWSHSAQQGINDDGKEHGYGEEEMDMEWAHAMAPAAHLMLVEGMTGSWPDYLRCVDAALAHGATVVSLSLAEPERDDHQAMYSDGNQHFENHQAIYVAAAGDHAHTARWPASSNNVVGVGGTTITTNESGDRLQEIAWSKHSNADHATATGGGLSIAVNEPQPQLAFGLPDDPMHKRGTPDVSSYATGKLGIAVYNSNLNPKTDQAPLWHQSGGTSAGAPMWAGILAIANASRIKIQKQPLSQFMSNEFGYGTLAALYSVAKYHPKAFFDITDGSNGDCGNECTATKGYDYLTGLGSPNGSFLIQELTELP